jgi:hypothetical protein
LHPCIYPFFFIGGLALGAMPVSARVIAYSYMVTSIVIAFIYMSAKGSSSAFANGIKHTQVVLEWLVFFGK